MLGTLSGLSFSSGFQTILGNTQDVETGQAMGLIWSASQNPLCLDTLRRAHRHGCRTKALARWNRLPTRYLTGLSPLLQVQESELPESTTVEASQGFRDYSHCLP